MIENLMNPRYMVKADYPFSPFSIGEIYTVGNTESGIVITDGMDKYPHLFRKLEWWEERELSEIEVVKYVKLNQENTIGGDIILTIRKWSKVGTTFSAIIEEKPEVMGMFATHFTPATLEQFTNYQKTKV